MEPLISVLKGCKKHREKILDIFLWIKINQRLGVPVPVSHLEPKKTSLQRDLLMAVPVTNNPL